MTTYYHGTDRTTFRAHEGLCLTLDPSVAADYGGTVYVIEVDEDLLSWDTVTVAEARALGDRDSVYPGDTREGRRILAEELDVDAIWYADVTPGDARPFRCLRLIRAEALAAIVSIEVL